MKKFVFLAVAALIGLAAVSCQPKETEPEDALSIAGATITVGKDAATPAISFTANKAWTAQSNSAWIVPATTSGEAGTVNLTLSVSENDTWEPRSGKVTITCGKVNTVFTVEQGTESVLETSSTFNVSPEAQDILVPVKTNLQYEVTPAEDSPWLTVVATKAAPQEGTVKVHVAANTELAPRTGSFSITAPGYSQTYTVVQDASWTPAVSAEAIYIANSQDIYDSETWTVNMHQQYVIEMATADEDQVTLVLNKKGEVKDDVLELFPIDKIPAATYGIDATGKKDDNTFSIISADGSEKYYTKIVSGGKEIVVYDGEITVEEADGVYALTAILIDAAGQQHSYAYEGALEMKNEFTGGHSEVNWKNTYNTHFTTKANEWYVSFYMPRTNPAESVEPASASFTFFTAAGDVDLNELPVGTYTFGVAEDDADLKYKLGKTKAAPGLLSKASVSLYTASGALKSTEVVGESTVLTISKNDDGTKNFKYSATVKPYYYDADNNTVYEDPVQVNIDIDVPLGKATDEQTHPADDKDDEFKTLEGPAGTVYVGYWYSNFIGSDDGTTPKPAIADTVCNVFSIGSNSSFNNVWSAFFSIITTKDWTYEKNFNGRFCSTPVPDGTYTFSTEAKIGALVPLMYGTGTSRCYVTNTYTGTTYYPVSGSITLSNGTITVDLTCKATEAGLAGRPSSPATIHLTGSTDFSCYYIQDWSAINRVKNFSIKSPVPVE